MSERMNQARAEAERRYPHHGEDIGDAYGHGHFMDGWLAADANPRPRTITRDQARLAKTMLTFSSNDSEADKVFAALGVEVVDDE